MARSDMFLRLEGTRTGVVQGESVDKAFEGQFDVDEWSWGMTAPTAVGTGQATGRTQFETLKIVKRADRGSTAIMQVLRQNELIKSAVLSVRKSGGASALPYFVVKLERARLVAYHVRSSTGADGAPVLMEEIELAFQECTVDYTAQSSTGAGRAASSFSASTDSGT